MEWLFIMKINQKNKSICSPGWKDKSFSLFKNELSKLNTTYKKAKNDHRKHQTKRHATREKYQFAKKDLENIGHKMQEYLEQNIPNQLHYEFLSQQNILDVLEIRLKALTVRQTILAFNKLSLKKRISRIEQACLYLQLTSRPKIAIDFQCYDDAYHYLKQCDQDFPLFIPPDAEVNINKQEGPV